MLIDAGELLADGGNANAQTAPRSLTADTDASRLEGAIVVAAQTGTALVTGPIVITSVVSSSGSTVVIWSAAEAGACDSATAPFALSVSSGASLTGFLLRQGQKLCAASGGSSAILWAGYRPY